MVETWHIDSASRSQAVAASSIAFLLDAPFDAEPAGRMLAFLNDVVPVDYLSLVEYVPDGRSGLATPELVEGHACADVYPDAADVVAAHFALAGVQPGTDFDAQRLHGIANCHGAADRSLRAVERGEEAVSRGVHLAAAKPGQL